MQPSSGLGERERLRRRAGAASLLMGFALVGVLFVAGLATAVRGDDVTTRSADGGQPETLVVDLPLFEGGRVTEDDLRGRVTVLNLWASWCGPCREEAPALRRIAEERDPERVAFLGVASRDAEAPARDFIEQFDVRYPNALDDGSVAQRYDAAILPTTLVFNAEGVLVARFSGVVTEARLRTLIDDAAATP